MEEDRMDLIRRADDAMARVNAKRDPDEDDVLMLGIRARKLIPELLTRIESDDYTIQKLKRKDREAAEKLRVTDEAAVSFHGRLITAEARIAELEVLLRLVLKFDASVGTDSTVHWAARASLMEEKP